jgi:protocatechuate 3,4-dioxygenase alpha subunit
MKLIPTASQTVGPFFSIGHTPLYQDAAAASADAITISGVITDGGGQPIPDCALEFWTSKSFARVPTSADGKYSVVLEAQAGMCEVLLFMRGLLKPVYTRMYLASVKTEDGALKSVPRERIATLIAQPSDTPHQYVWNIRMQGENETVFFDY